VSVVVMVPKKGSRKGLVIVKLKLSLLTGESFNPLSEGGPISGNSGLRAAMIL
jgi:hypothetical protein